MNPLKIDRLYYSRAARSTLDRYGPGFLSQLLAMLIVNSRLQIPLSEFEFTYGRSSGPGGQNVNKVNSKRLCVGQSGRARRSRPRRQRFLQRFASRLTNEGELLISSQRYRDQGRNVEDCLEKLRVHGGRSGRSPRSPEKDATDEGFERATIGRQARGRFEKADAPPPGS